MKLINSREVFEYPELVEQFCPTQDEEESGDMYNLFTGDPDYFNWGKHHKIPFVQYDNFVIVPEPDTLSALNDYVWNGLISPHCEQMLLGFFHKDFKEFFESVHSTWQDFEALTQGIAYRGGSGYTYSIWKYHKSIKIGGAPKLPLADPL